MYGGGPSLHFLFFLNFENLSTLFVGLSKSVIGIGGLLNKYGANRVPWGHSSIPNHTMRLVAMKKRNPLPFLGTIWAVFLTKDNLLTFLKASYCITYGLKDVNSFVKKNIPLVQKQDFYVTSNAIAIIIKSIIVTSFFNK